MLGKAAAFLVCCLLTGCSVVYLKGQGDLPTASHGERRG